MKILMAFFLIASLFVYWVLDKYRYYDFKITECSASIEAELVGSYSKDQSVDKGAPYYFRLVFNESNSNLNLGKASALLEFKPVSNTGNVIKIESVGEILVIKNKKVLVVESINIPYDDYHLSISINQHLAEKVIGECKINKYYSEEIRFRLWDILLSV